MRSTPRSEADEIAAARRRVQESRDALAHARSQTPASHAGPLADVEDAEWVRLQLARRRETEAHAAQDAGDRRRSRGERLRRALGLGPARREAPEPPGVHEATTRYLDERQGAHDTEEDLHPHRLDEAESDLADALTRDELARRAAGRDARDGI